MWRTALALAALLLAPLAAVAQNAGQVGVTLPGGGGALTLPATATAPYTFNSPITGSAYQWYCNGTAIGGATSRSYTESSACAALTVRVTSNASSVTSGTITAQFFFPTGQDLMLFTAIFR
jgi:hypothetical protein